LEVEKAEGGGHHVGVPDPGPREEVGGPGRETPA